MSTEHRSPHSEDADETRGVLDSTGAINTADIGLRRSATAQVPVTLAMPLGDDLDDDDVIEGETPSGFEPAIEVDPAESDRDDGGLDRAGEGDGVAPAVVEEPRAESTGPVPGVSGVGSSRRRDEPDPSRQPEPSREPDPVPEPASAERSSPAAEVAPLGSGAIPAAVPVESGLRGGSRPASVQDHRRTREAGSAPAVAETMTDAPVRRPDPGLASRRLDQFADRDRESADLLTADRLLDPNRLNGPEPEGLWSHLLYTLSGRRINLGDGKRARQRKALTARIAAPLPGTARFVPVLSRKGGVGKTTVTTLLGMALADAREDRVIAVDANPDRGTLADRIARTNGKTVRDLVRIHDRVTGYHDLSAVVARDATRLDVLASDTDPHVSEAFSDEDYNRVAVVAAHYYSLVLTDTGTGIVHSVMGATLERADALVIVAGLSLDEARLASETLTWLESNGYSDRVSEAVVVLNQSTPGTPMVRLEELSAHFRTRVAHVLRIPYDPQIAAGGAITFSALRPETRHAARELAAAVIEGLRARAA